MNHRFVSNDLKFNNLANEPNFADIKETICSYITTDKLSSSPTNINAFTLLHVNVRSLRKNYNSLLTLLLSMKNKPTFIAITESWLTSGEHIFFSIPEYEFISLPRESCRGGGVGIYVLRKFNFKVNSALNRSSPTIELLVIEIKRKALPNVVLGCVYRPPASDIDSFNFELESLLDSVLHINKPFLLAGDYNLNLLKCDDDVLLSKFIDIMQSYNMQPSVTRPTRVTEFSATLIDNIFTNLPVSACKSLIVYDDTSDHFPILLEFDLVLDSVPPNVISSKRFFNASNSAKFVANVSLIDWSDLIHCCTFSNDTDTLFNCFLAVFSDVFNSCFPLENDCRSSKRLRKPILPWLSSSLIKCCKTKSTLYKKYRSSKSVIDKCKYLAYKKKLKATLKSAEREYYEEKFFKNSDNIKKTWEIIGKILNRPTKNIINPSFLSNNVMISDNRQIAEEFNNYFATIGLNLAATIVPTQIHFSSFLPPGPSQSAVFECTDPLEIRSIICNLTSSCSTGVDEIPSSVIKLVVDYISMPLCSIINNAICNACFPKILKIAKVIPIHKSGDSSLFSNYRPISLLTNFTKIFEKVIFVRLKNFLAKINIPSNNQFGFQSKKSTSMAILEMVDKISSAIDSKNCAMGIFIDLAKAFDTVDHNILLEKLRHYGIRGISLDLIKSYLHDRMQYVSFNGFDSLQQPVSCGVPQGSILGPLLFLVYIDDMSNCSKLLRFILFADDTNIFFMHKTLIDMFMTANCELQKLSTWFRVNKLSLNVKKTNFIVFTARGHFPLPPLCDIKVDGFSVQRVQSCKFLGLFIDENLSWKLHISSIASTIARNIGIIKCIRSKINSKVSLLLYDTMISPYLTYGNIVWASCVKSNLERLHRLQKRAIRIIFWAGRLIHSAPLMYKLCRLSIYDIHLFQIYLFVHAHYFGQLPCAFADYFCKNNFIHNYSTRFSNDLHNFSVRTDFRGMTLRITGPKLWNALPNDLRICTSSTAFRRAVKLFLFSSYVI